MIVCKTKSKMPKKIMPWGKKRNMKGSRRNPTAALVVATILKPVKEDSVETATIITLILALRGPAVEATPRKDGQMNKSLIFKAVFTESSFTGFKMVTTTGAAVGLRRFPFIFLLFPHGMIHV